MTEAELLLHTFLFSPPRAPRPRARNCGEKVTRLRGCWLPGEAAAVTRCEAGGCYWLDSTSMWVTPFLSVCWTRFHFW